MKKSKVVLLSVVLAAASGVGDGVMGFGTSSWAQESSSATSESAASETRIADMANRYFVQNRAAIEERHGVRVSMSTEWEDVAADPTQGVRETRLRVDIFPLGSQYLTGDFHTTVLLSNVTESNIEQKMSEVLAIVHSQYARAVTQQNINREFLENRSSTATGLGPQTTFGNSVTTGAVAGIGRHAYASVWVQLPSVRSGNPSTVMPAMRSHWLRTQVQFDGVQSVDDSSNRVAVSRLVTDIYSIALSSTRRTESSHLGGAVVIRLGSVRAHLRTPSGGADATARFDVDVANLGIVDSYRLTQGLGFYYSMTARVGVRILKQNQARFQAQFGAETLIGLAIGQQLFVEAGVAGEGSPGANALNVFGTIGWRLTRSTALRVGLNYAAPASTFRDNARDPMAVIPEGVSANGGIMVRF